MYFTWQFFVVSYDKCSMSMETDKLVAINGIRRLILRDAGYDLCCGLWRDRLIQELCWQNSYVYEDRSDKPFPNSWRAPTWSWASNNVATYPSNMRHHTKCSEFQKRVTVEAVYVEELESGQLVDASLTLRGKILHAICVEEGEDCDGFGFVFVKGSDFKGRIRFPDALMITLDDPNTSFDSRAEITFLALLSCKCSEDGKQPERYLQALALERSQHNQYKRIGILDVVESCYDSYVTNETEEEYSLVII